VEQPRAGGELPRDHAQREHVDRRRPALAAHLLGRHVRRGPAHRSVGADPLRAAEIAQHQPGRADDQVGRRDVAVDPALRVQERDAGGGGGDQRGDGGARVGHAEVAAQVDAGHALEHEVRAIAIGAVGATAHHVGVRRKRAGEPASAVKQRSHRRVAGGVRCASA
jgi:hypothetical protein